MKRLFALVLSVAMLLTCAASFAEYTIQDPNVTPVGELPVVKEPITITVATQSNSNVTAWNYGENYLTTFLEDLTGIHIEWNLYPEVANDANSKLRLQIAGGEELSDVLMNFDLNTDSVRESYGQAGAIIPLNDYIGTLDYYHAQALAKTASAQQGINLWDMGRSLDGNIYAMLSLYYTLPNSYSARAWYNRDFVAALGMEEPEGTPTYEWMLEYLRGVRDNDVNGNGDPTDEVPMIGGTGWRQNVLMWILKMFTYIDYDTNWFQVENGQLSHAYQKDEFREGLKFARQMYDEGLFPDYALTQDNATYGAMMASETPIVGIGVSGSCSSFGGNMAAMNPIPVVEGPTGFKSATFFSQPPVFSTCITEYCEYPEAVFRMFDAFTSEEWYGLICRWGEPEKDWKFAAEGDLGMYDAMGYNAYFTQIQSVWGVPQASHWCLDSVFGTVDYSNINSRFSWDGNESNNEYKNALAVTKQVGYEPAEYVYKIIYSVDEQEEWANIRTAINDYVTTFCAQAATGQVDINDDAVWADFQAQVVALGCDDLLAMDQAAYNRTNGIEG